MDTDGCKLACQDTTYRDYLYPDDSINNRSLDKDAWLLEKWEMFKFNSKVLEGFL